MPPTHPIEWGGKAQWYAEPKAWQDIQEVFHWVDKQQIPFTCLGKGSNLLICDGGIEGLVLNTRHLNQYTVDETNQTITVGAGYSLPKLAWQVAKKRLGRTGVGSGHPRHSWGRCGYECRGA